MIIQVLSKPLQVSHTYVAVKQGRTVTLRPNLSIINIHRSVQTSWLNFDPAVRVIVCSDSFLVSQDIW